MDITLKSPTILVVDDTPTNLEVLHGALSHYGYEVLVEMDGESGIEQAQANLPDLILLDVMMPGIDGFETCRRLKLDPITQDIPVLFMTALSDTLDKVKGLKLGAVDYITKPFEQEEVIARMQVHLKLRQVSLELEREKQSLEEKVQARTTQLNQALEDLKEAQVHLVQSEKMSSLGQLVAGIAHEVNNPINFIYGNISHLEDYSEVLLSLAKLCQKHCIANQEVQDLIAEHDVEFVMEDLPQVLSSMTMGVSRIRQIVTSLRNFSRLDEAEVKPVNIHEGVESTLLILQNRLKVTHERPEIQIVKSYSDLPLVECHVGQLNQVLMNLLSNAIDAVEDIPSQKSTQTMSSKNSETGQITIRTEALGVDWIRISIKDNGCGIDEEIRTKIFDPFFTTKPIGKGTGLGLSISYRIITEKHQGRLLCLSEPGHGTEFIIEIPVHQFEESKTIYHTHDVRQQEKISVQCA